MAVPAKPQSRRNKPAPAIFANPSAEPTPFVSGAATFAEPAATVAVMTDPVAVEAAIEQIAVPVAETHAEIVEATTDAASETLESVTETAEATTTQATEIVADATDLGARTLETAAAHIPETDTVSTFSKGLFPMATAFDTTKAQDMMGDISTRAKGAMEKSVKFAEEMTEFTKGNVEAIVASSRVAAKGIESMAQDAAETAKSGFEQAQTALKSFTQVKSPTELFQLQSDYAKTAFDQLVANASKASEQMMKLMGDVAQPLSNRYALASEKVKSAAL